jgi:hypothetical protein
MYCRLIPLWDNHSWRKKFIEGEKILFRMLAKKKIKQKKEKYKTSLETISTV